MTKFSLAVHGGAGTLLKSKASASQEKAYHSALSKSLEAGYEILQKGGDALEAVERCVCELEDSPLFNAGRGSVFTHNRLHELEAAIMCGKSLQAGAVAAVTNVKNPISLCRAILDDDEFVYLVGAGAEEYAKEHDLHRVQNSYFSTDLRLEQLEKAIKAGDKVVLDHDADRKFGTVGAVALDSSGNLAAATSTGGLTNKKYGRVGDSSIIGSGCYASNDTCAISATGYGEFFIRNVTAHEIAAIMKYKETSLQEAADHVVMKQLAHLGGEGGVIGVDAHGNIILSFNSEGMYRGWVSSDDNTLNTAIYKS